MPRHHASRRSCQGATRPDAAVKAQRVQTQLARHNASRRSCHGATRPDAAVKAQSVETQLSTHHASGRSCRGICLPDEECHANCAQDAARVFRTQSVKAIFFQTEHVKANVWTTLTMAHNI